MSAIRAAPRNTEWPGRASGVPELRPAGAHPDAGAGGEPERLGAVSAYPNQFGIARNGLIG